MSVRPITIRKIIRTDGTETPLDQPVGIAQIEQLIGASCVSTVLLADRQHVMALDDNGYETEPVERQEDGVTVIELRCVRARKPVNAEATRLYREVCVPGTTHQIVGDVVIVPDSDFARW